MNTDGKAGGLVPTDKEIKAWAKDQHEQKLKYKLDGQKGAPELLERMLGAVGKNDTVNWASVAAYVRKFYPGAPKTAKTYKLYAESVLGWKSG